MSSRPRLLIINPNSSQSVTEAIKPVAESLEYNVELAYFTCPEPGVASIDGPSDAKDSAAACLPHLLPILSAHDAFLVACYSTHPLVHGLKQALRKPSPDRPNKHVTGIFEASVVASLGLLPIGSSNDKAATNETEHLDCEAFGIVSTCATWQEPLEQSVATVLGSKSSARFVGCETTGYSAVELHQFPHDQIKESMMQATARLIKRGQDSGHPLRVICLGCAGMAGMDAAIREACIRELGIDLGANIKIVDGIKAGIGALVSMCKAQY